MVNTRIIYFDVLRIVAILAVITLHVVCTPFTNTNVFLPSWEIYNLWESVVRWGVPCFVMISGALLLDPQREFSFRKLYQKNILHIVGVLLFWSVCYSGLCFVLGGEAKGNMRVFLSNLFLGYFHLWFLYMLLGLYLLIPLLRPICKDDKLLRYFVGLSIIFSFLFPTILKILSWILQVFPFPFLVTLQNGIVKLLEDKIQFCFTLKYVSYFVLGYYMSRLSLTATQRKIIYGLGFLGWFCLWVGERLISQHLQESFDIYSGSAMTLFILVETLAVFVFTKYHVCALSASIERGITHLAVCVIGIYLIHPVVQIGLEKLFHLSAQSFNPLVSVPIIVLLVFFLSWVGTEIIRKIPWFGKHIL